MYVSTHLLCLSFAHCIFFLSIRSHRRHPSHSECEARVSALSNRCDEAEAAALRSETARVDALAAAALELETGMAFAVKSRDGKSIDSSTVNMSNHSLIFHLYTHKKPFSDPQSSVLHPREEFQNISVVNLI
jgi:hypothetical protein